MAKMTGAQAISDAQRMEMRRDPRLILTGIDIRHLGGSLGQSVGLYQEFGGDRVIDMPISESGYTGAAVGMALSGIPTIVEIQFADFSAYAFDAIVNQAAKLRYLNDGRVNIPLTIRVPQGSGLFFGAQHSQIVESWYTNCPGLKIVAPGSASDMKGLLEAAIRDPDPVLVLEHKLCCFVPEEVPDGEYVVPIGKAKVVKEGKDLTIISWQRGMHYAGEALAELGKQGIDAELIDLRTLIPFDRETISASVHKTGRVLIVHEAPVRGGFGGELAAFVADECFADLKAPVKRVGAANIPLPFGGAENFILPSSADVVRVAQELMKG